MLSRWSRAISLCPMAGLGERLSRNKLPFPLLQNYSKAVERTTLDKDNNSFSKKKIAIELNWTIMTLDLHFRYFCYIQ
jgi:hypothetical protein